MQALVVTPNTFNMSFFYKIWKVKLQKRIERLTGSKYCVTIFMENINTIWVVILIVIDSILLQLSEHMDRISF